MAERSNERLKQQAEAEIAAAYADRKRQGDNVHVLPVPKTTKREQVKIRETKGRLHQRASSIMSPDYQANMAMLLGADPTDTQLVKRLGKTTHLRTHPHEFRTKLGVLSQVTRKAPEGRRWKIHGAVGITDPRYRAAIDPLPDPPKPKPRKPASLADPVLRRFEEEQKDVAKKPGGFLSRLARFRHWGALLAGALGGAGVGAGGVVGHAHVDAQEALRPRVESEASRYVRQHRESLITGESYVVAGENNNSPFAALIRERGSVRMGNLYMQMPGRDGGVDIFNTLTIDAADVLRFNPLESLETLWRVKDDSSLSKGRASAEGRRTFPPIYQNAMERGFVRSSNLFEQLSDSYSFRDGRDRGPLEVVSHQLDWEGIRVDESMTHEQIDTIRSLAERIDPLMIEALFMTEIMPHSDDGYMNMAMYEFTLERGGELYLLFVPALGDREASMSGSQATRFALRKGQGAGYTSEYLGPAAMADLHLRSDFAQYETQRGEDEAVEYKEAIATDPFHIHSLREHRVITLLNAINNLIYVSRTSPAAHKALDTISEALSNPD